MVDIHALHLLVLASTLSILSYPICAAQTNHKAGDNLWITSFYILPPYLQNWQLLSEFIIGRAVNLPLSKHKNTDLMDTSGKWWCFSCCFEFWRQCMKHDRRVAYQYSWPNEYFLAICSKCSHSSQIRTEVNQWKRQRTSMLQMSCDNALMNTGDESYQTVFKSRWW